MGLGQLWRKGLRGPRQEGRINDVMVYLDDLQESRTGVSDVLILGVFDTMGAAIDKQLSSGSLEIVEYEYTSFNMRHAVACSLSLIIRLP